MRIVLPLLALMSLISCSQTDEFRPGQIAAIRWDDGNWYLGTIKEIVKGRYYVDFTDGARDTVSVHQLMSIANPDELSAGDSVLALRGLSRMYPAVITSISWDSVEVRWCDEKKSTVYNGHVVSLNHDSE